MKLSHKGLGITDDEWEIFMRHAQATLTQFDVPAREAGDVLSFFTSLKSDVVDAG